MFFSALVLIPIYRKHDSLEQLIDLGHCDKAAEMCNMPWLTLQQEKQIAVLLRLLIIRE